MAFGKKPCCDGCARKPSKARISGNPIAHLFQMGGGVMKELESTDPLFIHEDEGYNTAVLSDMLRRDVEFDPSDDTYSREGSIEYWRNLLEEGVIDKDKYLSELAKIPHTPVEEEPYSPTPLELYVEEMTGMEPGLDRATFMPWAGSREEGNFEFAAPALVYELAKALNAPGVALSGEEITPEEVFNTAGLLTAGSFGGSGVRNVLAGEGVGSGLGMATVPPGGIKGLNQPFMKKLKNKGDAFKFGEVGADEFTELFSRVPRGNPYRSGESTIDTQLRTLAEDLRSDYGVSPELLAPFYDKMKRYLEVDYGTARDPLRSALFSGRLPAEIALDLRPTYTGTRAGRAGVEELKNILQNPEKSLQLATDDAARVAISRKLAKKQALTPEEEALWNNPPPVRVEAERAYDRMVEARANYLFPSEEARQNFIFENRAAGEWPNMDTSYEVTRSPDELSFLANENLPLELVNYNQSSTYTLPKLEQEYSNFARELGLPDVRDTDVLTAWEKLNPKEGLWQGELMDLIKLDPTQEFPLDPTFAKAVENTEPVWSIGERGRVNFPLFDYDLMGQIYSSLLDDPSNIPRASFVDMMTSGAQTMLRKQQREAGVSKDFKEGAEKINSAVRDLGEETVAITADAIERGRVSNYADDVDALLDPSIWEKGASPLLPVPSTDSTWLQVKDPDLLELYGTYLSNSIGGYSHIRNNPGYGAGSGGAKAIEDGSVVIYGLHDYRRQTIGHPRVVVEVIDEGTSPLKGRTGDFQMRGVGQVKGRKGAINPRHSMGTDPWNRRGRVSVEGNRPPHSRDVLGLFELFTEVDVNPFNVEWSEFIETITNAPVNDPLRRAYVRYVDDENASLISDGEYFHHSKPPPDPDMEVKWLDDRTMDMLRERENSLEDTPVNLPWLLNKTDEASIAGFFEDAYYRYSKDVNPSVFNREEMGRDAFVGPMPIWYRPQLSKDLSDALEAAAALPEPPITEW